MSSDPRLNNSTEHTRVNDILLGPLERPALKWLAAHSPPWLTPDICTSIGVLGSIIILVGYVLSRYSPWFFWLASFGFLVNWYGDSLDGTLARYRHIERPVFGFYIDHTTDALSQVLIFVGLGLSPYISLNIALLALVSYLLITVLVYIRIYVVKEFKLSYGKLGPTEVRFVAVLANTIMFFWGGQVWLVEPGSLGKVLVNPYNLATGVVALVIFLLFLNTGIREAIRLRKEYR